MKNERLRRHLRFNFLLHFAFYIFIACSPGRKIGAEAKRSLFNDTLLSSAHIGISIYDADNQKYLYNYQGDKYFIPASNVKLFTLYTGLKYLQDSLVAARVAADERTVIMQATGDPTFLHPDFPNQPLLKFLQRKEIQLIRLYTPFATTSFGAGWSWDDYKYEYMAERDPFPMYGNIATVIYDGDSIRTIPKVLQPFVVGKPEPGSKWEVTRALGGQIYTIDTTIGSPAGTKRIPMAMSKGLFASRYLADTLLKTVLSEYYPLEDGTAIPIYSQPKDSLFKKMMHSSNNLFAEQTLLMASNEHLGEMDDAKMIVTVLNSDLTDIPQRPRWVDGSGLSRYNLFSPQDFVYILNKLKNEYKLERMQELLPAGNEGTLEGLYKGYEKNIWAKTGSMSNNIGLSGYLITKRNKRLTFSILVNNYRASAITVRKQIERFLTGIVDSY
jgi:D-alanyl-D-alanine carboxypeptidase/D-alanyl-D-alanine-endopeptidase (penicillin-binding protein 4)